MKCFFVFLAFLLGAISDAQASAFPSITISAAGASNPVTISAPPNLTIVNTFNLGVICTISSGAVLIYEVDVTADPKPSTGGNWNPHDTLQGLGASANGNILFPITGVRVNITSYTSGSVNCGFAQWP